jgi:hypothetical protein
LPIGLPMCFRPFALKERSVQGRSSILVPAHGSTQESAVACETDQHALAQIAADSQTLRRRIPPIDQDDDLPCAKQRLERFQLFTRDSEWLSAHS